MPSPTLSTMIYKTVVLLIFQISTTIAAPLQFPLLAPLPGTLQQQQLALQEQMLAIQQFQALQRFNAMPSPVAMSPQPLLLLIPNEQPNLKQVNRINEFNENLLKNEKASQPIEDDDSITIDADIQETDRIDAKNSPMKAILLVPNARLSLGEFISSIPFLPFEINVPDSISWIYGGISGIISGIGQSWPFNRPQSGENVKSVWNYLKTKKFTPIVMIPLGQPMLPVPV